MSLAAAALLLPSIMPHQRAPAALLRALCTPRASREGRPARHTPPSPPAGAWCCFSRVNMRTSSHPLALTTASSLGLRSAGTSNRILERLRWWWSRRGAWAGHHFHQG
jgi:hypothetical protein